MNIIYYQNNSSNDYMIDDLGVLLDANSRVNFQGSIPHEELCESADLKTAIQSSVISVYDNNDLFSINDAIDYLTITSFIEDARNEQWYFEAGTHTRITKYTQLRIAGRILTAESNAHVIMDEGSDIIVE